jgi:hypothetical protein
MSRSHLEDQIRIKKQQHVEVLFLALVQDNYKPIKDPELLFNKAELEELDASRRIFYSQFSENYFFLDPEKFNLENEKDCILFGIMINEMRRKAPDSNALRELEDFVYDTPGLEIFC